LGDCLLWTVFSKITDAAQILGYFPMVKVMHKLRQKRVGLHFGRFFSQTNLVTLIEEYLSTDEHTQKTETDKFDTNKVNKKLTKNFSDELL
jgi:hypothetical protein